MPPAGAQAADSADSQRRPAGAAEEEVDTELSRLGDAESELVTVTPTRLHTRRASLAAVWSARPDSLVTFGFPSQVLTTAIGMLRAISAKITANMTSQPPGSDDADLDKLGQDYVQAVRHLNEILEDKLVGRNDQLTYRTNNRSSYGPLLDLNNTADAIVVVHDELKDLKQYLAEATCEDAMQA